MGQINWQGSASLRWTGVAFGLATLAVVGVIAASLTTEKSPRSVADLQSVRIAAPIIAGSGMQSSARQRSFDPVPDKLSLASSVQAKSQPTDRSWPRLKPKNRPLGHPILSVVTPGMPLRVSASPAGIAVDDDFTGGRNSLFSAYSREKSRARAERAYETIALPKGISPSETLITLGGHPDNVKSLLQAASSVSDLQALKAGDAVDYAFETVFVPTPIGDANGHDASSISFVSARRIIARLRFRPEDRKVVTAWRQSDGSYAARIETLDIEKRYAAVAGVIRRSLFSAAARSEVPPEIMTRFANLFLYDIDFARDIHAGDKFEAVYEVFYDSHGSYVGTGDIVFAAMSWRGGRGSRSYYRFDHPGFDETPYFDAQGESATRLLMKTPIEGAKVTSGFGKRRHPILGYSKSHRGVDFGATKGTPVMAAGDGIIQRAAPTGTFGNYIRIEHALGFATAYAHLDRFASGIASGTKVRQGQIIGYVGSTGRSTGPHLHYEVWRGNQVKNPMTLQVASGRALDDSKMIEFEDHRGAIDSARLHPLTVVIATSQ